VSTRSLTARDNNSEKRSTYDYGSRKRTSFDGSGVQ
jgi:hypothetical protein